VRLGGGGNEDLEVEYFVTSITMYKTIFYIVLGDHCLFVGHPGLALPAERLRAVLSVGTNRASFTSTSFQHWVYVYYRTDA
jgi:hypothetical protein